jgi:hypothetical protein
MTLSITLAAIATLSLIAAVLFIALRIIPERRLQHLLTVSRDVDLRKVKFRKLPDNLSTPGNLFLGNNIDALPANLSVGDNLDLQAAKLSHIGPTGIG